MKKLKLLTLLFINLLFVIWPPKTTNSCGFYLSREEYRFWTFDPNNSNEAGLQPLFYSLDYCHNGFNTSNNYGFEIEQSDEILGEYADNLKLWQAYCLKVDPSVKVNVEDIETILYHTEPIDYFKIKEGLLEQNSFLKFAAKNKNVLTYLDYAKKSEYQSNYHESWFCFDCPEILAPGKMKPGNRNYYYYDVNIQPDPITGLETIEKGKLLLNNCTDFFLKQRYAYQIVRTSFYNYDSTSLREYYFKYLDKMPVNSWLRNNAYMYEVLFRDSLERNIGLTKIFEICPDKRYRCEELFQDALFEPSLKLVNNNHDKAMLYVMHCLQKPMEQLESIKNIMALEPSNKFLPFLWVREINKLEDWILGADYTVGSTKNESFFSYDEMSNQAIFSQKQKDLQYANFVLTTLEHGMQNGSIPTSAFYNLCAGYIAFIGKDISKANEYYNKVAFNQLNAIGQTQLLINKLMLSLSQTEKITPQIEDKLAECLVLLYKNSAENPQYKTLQMQLINFAAKEFRDRGEPAKGLMLYGKSVQPYAYHPLLGIANVYTQIFTYATPDQIDEQLAILNKPNPNALEVFLSGKIYSYTYDYGYEDNFSLWDQNKLLDIKSMKLVQQDKLLLAYETVKLIDTAYWSNEVNSIFKRDDPFCLNPWNGHDPMNFRNVSYNKKTFLKELIDLKLKASKSNGEEKAQLLLKIANAYYSMSYSGKYWIMQKNFQGGWEPEQENKDVDPTYYSGARAKYYYKLILQTSYDPKLLGATIYILNTAFETNEAQLEKNRAVIRRNPIATDYYEQLSANCDLFYEFIKTYN